MISISQNYQRLMRGSLRVRITAYADGVEATPLVVTGAPGCGKSALLANFAKQYTAQHPDVFVLSHFIGVSPGSTDIRRTQLRLCRELKQHFQIAEEIPDDYQELRQKLPVILEQACSHAKVVLMLDGLNQLDESHYAHALHWLPQTLPRGLRLIVSTPEGDCLDALRSRKSAPQEIVISPLEEEDRKQIVRQTLRDYRKRLDEDRLDERYRNTQMGLLLDKRDSDTPLYLIVACEELRMFGEFERVTERIAGLPDDVAELFEQVLERLEHDHGRELVESALSLLECSRHGLLESEILELVARAGEEQLPPAIWARLYRSLRFYLRPPGESGEGALDFFHRQLAKAVRTRYLEDEEREIAVHWRLAETFTRKADPTGDGQWSGNYPRALGELPFHLLEGKLYEALFQTARDDAFLTAQMRAFADEPRLHLETIQAAIEGSTRSDDAAAMAEFVLAHARRILEARRQSPLAALRAGHLDRAWKLADLFEIERCELWYLLLAWELQESGTIEEARETLTRVLQKQVVSLSGWRDELASMLVMHAFDVDEAAFLQLLSATGVHHTLSEHFSSRGNFGAALQVARSIDDKSGQVEALSAIAAAQAKAGEGAAARDTFAEAQATAREIANVWDRATALKQIASACADVGDTAIVRNALAEAAAAARQIESEEGKAKSLRGIAVAQAQVGEVADARNSFAESLAAARHMASERESAAEMRWTADAQARAGQISEAVAAARQISHAGNREAALSEIAAAGARAGQFSEALAAARQIASQWDRAKAFRDIAVAQAQAGETGAARESLAEALAAARQIASERGRATVLQDIAAAQHQAGEATAARGTFADALAVARQVVDKGDRAEVLKWIAEAQARAGEMTAARGTFDEAVVSAQEIADHRYGGGRLLEIATAQTQARQFADALETARQIPDEEYRASSLRTIAEAQAEAGVPAAARETFAEALAAAHQIPYGGDKAATLMKIVVAQAEAGQFSEAHAAAQEIEHAETRVDAVRGIASAQARAGQFVGALASARRIANEERREETLSEIAAAQAQAGATSDARDTLAEALAATQQTEDLLSRASALKEIAGAQARAGETGAARHTFAEAVTSARQIQDQDERALALNEIAVAQAHAREFGAARETFGEVLAAAQHIPAEERRSAVLRGIASAQAEAGQVAAALGALAEALVAAQLIASEWSRDGALCSIAVAYAKTGQFSDAYALAEQIEYGGFKEWALRDIKAARMPAAEMAVVPDISSSALDAARRIEDQCNRVRALNVIAEARAHAHETSSAHDIFAEALELTQQIAEQVSRQEALEITAVAQARAGFGNESLQTASLILTDRDQQLPKIARALADAGDKESFKGLLIPCAYYLNAAYRMCGLVAPLYQEQVTAVAAVASSRSEQHVPARAQPAVRGLPPRPYPGADPQRASELNLKYQQDLVRWKALPRWRRLMIKRPERPTGI